MFTGLIQELGTLLEVRPEGGPLRLTVATPGWKPDDLALGESIANNGVCLTVVARHPRGFVAEAGQETLERTTVGTWEVGRKLNLERALRLEDRLGGHLVLGHVDATAEVVTRREEQGVLHLEVALLETLAPLVCEKGSVAIDGVSLTVNEASRTRFRVTLIPETVRRTTLGALKPGDRVNLEADVLARHVARLLAFGGGRGESESDQENQVDLAFLARHGYL